MLPRSFSCSSVQTSWPRTIVTASRCSALWNVTKAARHALFRSSYDQFLAKERHLRDSKCFRSTGSQLPVGRIRMKLLRALRGESVKQSGNLLPFPLIFLHQDQTSNIPSFL